MPIRLCSGPLNAKNPMPTPLPARGLVLACSLVAASAQAFDRIEVSFNDPSALYSAYYADIQRVAAAAGDSWLTHFIGPDTPLALSVQISFASIATANGRSATSVYLGITAAGLRLFEQGAAHEVSTGIDPNGAAADIEFTLGIDGYLQQELWFDPSPGTGLLPVPLAQTDAYSVMQHEFGHAFGFNGWRDGSTGALPGDYLSTFDALVTPQALPGGSTAFYFTGTQASAQYGGPVPLTLANYGHLGNTTAAMGADLLPDLMNGVAFYRGTRYEISALDLQVMRDLGLPAVLAVPEPAAGWLFAAGLFAVVMHRRKAARG